MKPYVGQAFLQLRNGFPAQVVKFNILPGRNKQGCDGCNPLAAVGKGKPLLGLKSASQHLYPLQPQPLLALG